MQICRLPTVSTYNMGVAVGALTAGYLLWRLYQVVKLGPRSILLQSNAETSCTLCAGTQAVHFVALFVRAHALLAAQPELPVVVDHFNPFDRKARSFTATQPQRLGVADSRALGGIMRIQIARCFNVCPRPLAPGLSLLLVLLHALTSWPLLH